MNEVNKFLSEFKSLLKSKFPTTNDEVDRNVRIPLSSMESAKRISYAQMLMNQYDDNVYMQDKEQFQINPPPNKQNILWKCTRPNKKILC